MAFNNSRVLTMSDTKIPLDIFLDTLKELTLTVENLNRNVAFLTEKILPLQNLDSSIADLNQEIINLRKVVETEGKNRGRGTGIVYRDVIDYIELPQHLRKTYEALLKLGKGTDEEVHNETGRARAVESDYLNQLHTMRYLVKKRNKRKVFFFIPGGEEDEEEEEVLFNHHFNGSIENPVGEIAEVVRRKMNSLKKE